MKCSQSCGRMPEHVRDVQNGTSQPCKLVQIMKPNYIMHGSVATLRNQALPFRRHLFTVNFQRSAFQG